MKTVFPALAGLILLLGWLPGCYSAEFFPGPGYHNLRREFVGEPEIRLSPPVRAHRELGILLLRNFAGDLQDENFLAFLRKEIKSLGAQGGWVARRRFHQQVQYETGTASARRPGSISPTGEITTTVGVIQIVLYNYDEAR